MARKLFRYALAAAMLLGSSSAFAAFKDFSIDLRTSDLLTAEEQVQWNPVSFAATINDDGTLTRVDDGATADVTLSGKYHGTGHGWAGITAVLEVNGPVRITLGSCAFSSGNVTVTDAAGNEVSSFAGTDGTDNGLVSGYYKGEAGQITVSFGSYVHSFAMEAVDPSELIEETNIVFDLGESGAQGILPANVKGEVGSTTVIPANRTLYVEGKTLTGWTDGVNTYAPGANVEFAATDLTLTPVFTDNTVSLADRKDAVTLKWDFQQKNGAPILAWQGKECFYVTQAVVNGETIDVITNIDTTNGKVANGNWQDWCQMNNGTKFVVPSCKGAVVSIEAYNNLTTTTIDGQADYASGKTISYEVMNTADNVEIVIGSDGSYYRYIQVVLPYVAPSAGGTVYAGQEASIVWPLNNAENYATDYTATPEDDFGFQIVSVNIPNAKVIGTEAGKLMDEKSTGWTFIKVQPNTGASDVVEWSVTPVKGLTFTPTKITMHICRFGTDAENGVTIVAKNDKGVSQTLGTYTARRNGKDDSGDKYSGNSNATSYVEIELTDAQKEALATDGAFTISATIGVGNAKQGGFSDVQFYGLLDGTIAEVAKYPVTIAADPAEGGEVSIYPVSEQYTEGTEVKITAEEYFGYDFVNWTDADSNVVSTDPVFNLTVDAAYDLTANFVAVNTYELNYSVDGGANLYMVTPSPAPTVVDGKNMYEAGTNVSLVASSNPIVTFTNWSDGQTSGEIIVKMDQDIELTANYTAVDYVAGWDFYLAGAGGRPADFASVDNTSSSLVLRTDDGENAAWLDKSQMAAGGYEGRPGAVNWRTGTVNGDVGNYYFQTMVNASAFTNLKVQTSSVYNYNSYKKYDIQYSLDGENWTTVGSLNMPGTKAWTDVTVDLPTDADNQAEVYIRWYPDRNSDIDGTASKNDGFCLGASYITGTAKIVDDGVAPVLVSTVPVNGADNASANGKVVLTFDEKVKVADGAVATLGGKELTPSVAGKVITFEYKGLEYSTDYTFTLAAGQVMDLTDNAMAEAITINFSTKAKPEVAKALFDFIVPDDGNFREAINAANARPDKTTRFRIFIKQGAHVSPTQGEMAGTNDNESNTYPDPRVDLTTNYVSIIGEGMDNTSVVNVCPAAVSGTTNPIEGLRHAYTLHNSGTGTYIQDIKLINGMNDATGRGEAYEESGDKTILKNVGLWGYQDTYCSNNGSARYYFEGGVVRGRTDYICGKDDIFFNGVEFRNVGNGGYIAVPSKPKQYGWILRDCSITAEDLSDNNGKYTLGRPWGSGTPIALWINTTCVSVPKAEGWNEMSNGWPARFAEYNSVDSNGNAISLKNRKTTFGDGHANDPVLTAEEAAFYTIANVLGGDDNWDPTEATEQASAPANVVISDAGVLSWDNSNYVLCWAVCQDGKVVAFTTEPEFDTATIAATFDAATPVYSVRAANEMGGLGEAAVAKVQSGVIVGVANSAEVVSTVYYNLTGARVEADYTGVVVRVDKLADGSTVATKVVNK